MPLTQLKGEIRIEKERSLSLRADASGGDVEPIDIRELTLVPPEGAIAYRYFRQPEEQGVSVSLTASRFAIQEVIPTVVEKALVEIATSRHTDATYRCRYRIKSVERQRLRVDLPAGMELLGAFVDGREVKPSVVEKAARSDELVTPYDINIDRAGQSDVPFLLTLQFNWSITPQPYEATYGRGELALPLPRIGGSEAPALVQELRTTVYAPDGFWLVGTPDKFQVEGARSWLAGLFDSPTAASTESPENWIADQTSSGLSLPIENLVPTTFSNLGGAPTIQVVWWNRLKISLLLSLALAVVAFVLLATSWENKLGLLLLLGFAAALFGLSDLPAMTHGLAAARYGLLFLLALWVVHGIFQLRLIVTAAESAPTLASSAVTTLPQSTPSDSAKLSDSEAPVVPASAEPLDVQQFSPGTPETGEQSGPRAPDVPAN